MARRGRSIVAALPVPSPTTSHVLLLGTSVPGPYTPRSVPDERSKSLNVTLVLQRSYTDVGHAATAIWRHGGHGKAVPFTTLPLTSSQSQPLALGGGAGKRQSSRRTSVIGEALEPLKWNLRFERL